MSKETEINELDLEAIAEQIKDGYTSGILDGETEKGKQKRISWEIKMEAWEE